MNSTLAVIGAAESERLGIVPDQSSLGLSCDAAIRALRDCAISSDEVDGIASLGEPPITVAHALGITPTWIDGTVVGGTSPLLHIRHAAAAIAAGHCTVALITHGQSGRSRVAGETPPIRTARSPEGQFELPYGTGGPPTKFPIGVMRFMAETGTTEEQLAMVAVQQRVWAGLNPRALMRDPITVDDVFDSPLICYPMHRLECCVITDGGGALVVASAAKAKGMDLPKPPVHLLGSGEASEGPMISIMEDFTRSKAFRIAGTQAFASAGLGPRDVDHLMVYDAFAHLPLFGLEDLGFVKRGEAGAFIAEGNTLPGGKLPLNTNGGGLSYTHTGMYGMFATLESIRQMRGEAAAQLPDVNISMTLGVGGMFTAAGALIWGKE